MKVLWLASWYPNKLSPYAGDFVKRHAEAVSLYEDIHVISVVKDVYGEVTRDLLVEENVSGRLTETIIYYHIPLTCFSPEALDGFKSLSYYWRLTWKKLAAEAESISAVSNFLVQCLKKAFKVRDYCIIPNVVNDTIFFFDPLRNQGYRKFIYISTLVDFKKPELVLAAFMSVINVYPDAQLNIIGPHKNRYNKWIADNRLERNILFFDEMPQTELVEFIKSSDALFLYSSYETFGCVIAEANACGVPVIVSDIPAMREIVQEGVNGFFAPANDPDTFAATIIKFMRDKPEINNNAIAADAISRYNYNKVGKMFVDWYDKVLKSV